ncbi:MAG TPA: prolyl aminopeptidase [Acidimicrobiales bacterium]
MAELYPTIEPHASGHLDVGDGHLLYWETTGNPSGRPAVWLHGGPGSGSGTGIRRCFDPMAYRLVVFDQRGCGRSRPLADGPHADLTTNTTSHLLADLETLRDHLGIDRWVVAGASWGVTLALAYAQRFPHRVEALALMSVTAGRRMETDWITRSMRRIFPREWDAFTAVVPEGERDGDLAAAYGRMLADPDPQINERAALAWCEWEDVHVSLAPGWTPALRYEDPTFRQVFARLVTHYWSNGCFLDASPILHNMACIAHIPGVLIHGRYDVSGPLDTAWDLHRLWPASRLVVVDDAGHGGVSMTAALIDALDDLR